MISLVATCVNFLPSRVLRINCAPKRASISGEGDIDGGLTIIWSTS